MAEVLSGAHGSFETAIDGLQSSGWAFVEKGEFTRIATTFGAARGAKRSRAQIAYMRNATDAT